MQQMTYEKNTGNDGGLPEAKATVVSRARPLSIFGPAALFALTAAAIAGDIVADMLVGVVHTHLALEAAAMGLSLAGVAMMWRQLRSVQARARDLERDLDGTRVDLARWRSEAQEVLRGLGVAIDGQFERWELTPAEREVALLLLKGLSLKDIGSMRSTSERTVRQQALAVYRKAGLAGRAELSAFFLEDLLLPTTAPRMGTQGQRGPSD
jgi:DNA-binding CsgD family transcriptional regulator